MMICNDDKLLADAKVFIASCDETNALQYWSLDEDGDVLGDVQNDDIILIINADIYNVKGFRIVYHHTFGFCEVTDRSFTKHFREMK